MWPSDLMRWLVRDFHSGGLLVRVPAATKIMIAIFATPAAAKIMIAIFATPAAAKIMIAIFATLALWQRC